MLHDRIVPLTVVTEDAQFVPDEQRLELEDHGSSLYRRTVRYGSMDEPALHAALQVRNRLGLEFSMKETSFFLWRRTIVPPRDRGMALWRRKWFAAMSCYSASAAEFFRLPTIRAVDPGTQWSFEAPATGRRRGSAGSGCSRLWRRNSPQTRTRHCCGSAWATST